MLTGDPSPWQSPVPLFSSYATDDNAALKLDPALLRSLLGISDLLVVVLDPEGRIRLFNRACEQVTGFSGREIVGQSLWETLIPEEEQPDVKRIAERLKAGETDNQFTNHWLTRGGEKRLIHWRNAGLVDDDGQMRHIVGTGIDITVLDRTSKALAGHQRQLQTLFDALPALVAEIDSEYCVRSANHGYRDWFGLDPKDQLGRHLVEVIGEQAFSILQPRFAQALAGEISVYHGEVPYARGGTRFIHGTYVPSRKSDGNVDGFYILSVDLTEQNRLRELLEEETRRSRTIIEHSLDSVITIDEAGIIQGFNPAAERLFGYRADEIMGQNVAILMPEEQGNRHDDFLRAYTETGQAKIIGIGREVIGRHAEGHDLDLQLTVAEFMDGQRYFVGFLHDISQRKQAEREAREHLAELAHLTRVNALSEVTSGLAHEISQPLMAISTLAEAGRMMLDKPEVDVEAVLPLFAQIARQGQRAGEIIQQLRTFLRKDHADQFEAHQPEELIRNVLALLNHELESAKVKVRLEMADAPACCKANRVQIEQVLFNLIKNAVDAMRSFDGDRILKISCSDSDENGHCRFEISDAGPGIPEDDLERLFHPFFTTKKQGLGQGLSICRSIIHRHGGTIHARNDHDGGAVFEFTLPTGAGE